MKDLSQRKCDACRIGSPSVTDSEVKQFFDNFDGWDLINDKGISKIQKEFVFPDFEEALVFTNELGAMAENQGHHPSITLQWGKVSVIWWTHKIKDLHMNDFIMAAKTDDLYG